MVFCHNKSGVASSRPSTPVSGPSGSYTGSNYGGSSYSGIGRSAISGGGSGMSSSGVAGLSVVLPPSLPPLVEADESSALAGGAGAAAGRERVEVAAATVDPVAEWAPHINISGGVGIGGGQLFVKPSLSRSGAASPEIDEFEAGIVSGSQMTNSVAPASRPSSPVPNGGGSAAAAGVPLLSLSRANTVNDTTPFVLSAGSFNPFAAAAAAAAGSSYAATETAKVVSPLGATSFPVNPFTSNDAAGATPVPVPVPAANESGSGSGAFTAVQPPQSVPLFSALPPQPQMTQRPAFESFGFGFVRPSNATTPTAAAPPAANGDQSGFTSNDAPQPQQPSSAAAFGASSSFSPIRNVPPTPPPKPQQSFGFGVGTAAPAWSPLQMRAASASGWNGSTPVQQPTSVQRQQLMQRQQQQQQHILSSQRMLFGSPQHPQQPAPQRQTIGLSAALVPACNGQCKANNKSGSGLGMLTLTRAGSIACTGCGQRAFQKLALADTDPYQLKASQQSVAPLSLSLSFASPSPLASSVVGGSIAATAAGSINPKRAVKPVSSYGAVRQLPRRRIHHASASQYGASIHTASGSGSGRSSPELSPKRESTPATGFDYALRGCYGVGESVNHSSLKSRRAIRTRAIGTAAAGMAVATGMGTVSIRRGTVAGAVPGTGSRV